MTKTSHSQAGEDRIVAFLWKALNPTAAPTYLDLGAAHPIDDNNTYLSYEMGGDGVLVEADSGYGAAYREHRPRDVAIHAAIVPARLGHQTHVEFFKSDDPGWNTISKAHAEIGASLGKGYGMDTLQVPARTVASILETFFPHRSPDYVSIDVEGIDGEILSDWDFRRYRPKILVVENAGGRRIHDEIMFASGYQLYGFTLVNSIYVDGGILNQMRF